MFEQEKSSEEISAKSAPATEFDPALSAWRLAAQRGVRILQERAQALLCKPPGHDGHMSLFSLNAPSSEWGVQGTRVVFITWATMSAGTAKSGRIVHIDNKDRAVYSVTQQHPVHTLNDTMGSVVHPAIGVRMEKARNLRPTIPADMLHLQAMWENALGAKSNSEDTSFCGCLLCGGNEESCFRCSLCLSAYHMDCMGRLHQYSG